MRRLIFHTVEWLLQTLCLFHSLRVCVRVCMLGVVSVCTCSCVYTRPKMVCTCVCSLLNGSMFSFLSHSYTLKRVVEGLPAELPWLLMLREMNFDLLCPISYPADSHVMARRISNSSQTRTHLKRKDGRNPLFASLNPSFKDEGWSLFLILQFGCQ